VTRKQRPIVQNALARPAPAAAPEPSPSRKVSPQVAREPRPRREGEPGRWVVLLLCPRRESVTARSRSYGSRPLRCSLDGALMAVATGDSLLRRSSSEGCRALLLLTLTADRLRARRRCRARPRPRARASYAAAYGPPRPEAARDAARRRAWSAQRRAPLHALSP
jgi:hypothetical protein